MQDNFETHTLDGLVQPVVNSLNTTYQLYALWKGGTATHSFFLSSSDQQDNKNTCTSADLLEDLYAGFQRFRPGFRLYIASQLWVSLHLAHSLTPVTYINQHISAGLAPD